MSPCSLQRRSEILDDHRVKRFSLTPSDSFAITNWSCRFFNGCGEASANSTAFHSVQCSRNFLPGLWHPVLQDYSIVTTASECKSRVEMGLMMAR
jgi:hypothetical protein